jgi:hypothetical protein
VGMDPVGQEFEGAGIMNDDDVELRRWGDGM